jgi:hypothetical protein
MAASCVRAPTPGVADGLFVSVACTKQYKPNEGYARHRKLQHGAMNGSMFTVPKETDGVEGDRSGKAESGNEDYGAVTTTMREVEVGKQYEELVLRYNKEKATTDGEGDPKRKVLPNSQCDEGDEDTDHDFDERDMQDVSNEFNGDTQERHFSRATSPDDQCSHGERATESTLAIDHKSNAIDHIPSTDDSNARRSMRAVHGHRTRARTSLSGPYAISADSLECTYDLTEHAMSRVVGPVKSEWWNLHCCHEPESAYGSETVKHSCQTSSCVHPRCQW